LPVLINDHELSISKLVDTTAGDLCFLLLNFENSLLRCENCKIFDVNRDKKIKNPDSDEKKMESILWIL
jgi:hypothetical protein